MIVNFRSMPRRCQTRKLFGAWLLLFVSEPAQIVSGQFSRRENQQDEMTKQSGSLWRRDELLRSPETNALSVERAERAARPTVWKSETHHLPRKALQFPGAFEMVDGPFRTFSSAFFQQLVSYRIGRLDGVRHRLIRVDRS